MRKSRFTETQEIDILKWAETAARVADLAREHGVSNAPILTLAPLSEFISHGVRPRVTRRSR